MEHISLLLPNSIITAPPLTQQITLSTLKVPSALQSLPFKLTLTMNQLKHDLVRDHRSFNVQEDLLNADPVVSSLWRLPWECIKFQNPFSENQGNNTNNQRTRRRKTSVKSVLSATWLVSWLWNCYWWGELNGEWWSDPPPVWIQCPGCDQGGRAQ